MLTGEYRAPSADFKQDSTGLVSGHVGDRSTIGGGPSYVHDADPNGGLSGGSTPRLFTESDAAKKLRDAPSAEKELAKWRGDKKHDPATRLAGKSFNDHPHSSVGPMVAQQIVANGHLAKLSADFAHYIAMMPLQ